MADGCPHRVDPENRTRCLDCGSPVFGRIQPVTGAPFSSCSLEERALIDLVDTLPHAFFEWWERHDGAKQLDGIVKAVIAVRKAKYG